MCKIPVESAYGVPDDGATVGEVRIMHMCMAPGVWGKTL
jgi:hypothetical protein